jgi:hypothetical protein
VGRGRRTRNNEAVRLSHHGSDAAEQIRSLIEMDRIRSGAKAPS